MTITTERAGRRAAITDALRAFGPQTSRQIFTRCTGMPNITECCRLIGEMGRMGAICTDGKIHRLVEHGQPAGVSGQEHVSGSIADDGPADPSLAWWTFGRDKLPAAESEMPEPLAVDSPAEESQSRILLPEEVQALTEQPRDAIESARKVRAWVDSERQLIIQDIAGSSVVLGPHDTRHLLQFLAGIQKWVEGAP